MITLVLLPGMDGTGDLFAEFALALGDEIAPIIIGYPADQPMGYEELEEYIRVHLPVDQPYVILGESFSGPIAISIASSQPAGLIGLILCCTFASNPLPLLNPIRHLISLLPISNKLTIFIAPFLFGQYSSRMLRRNLQQILGKVTAGTLRRRLRAVFDIDVSILLEKIQIPILYLQAEDDRIVPISALNRIYEHAKNLQVVTFSAPHLLLQAIPSKSAEIVKTFIDKVSAINAENNSANP